MGKIAGGRVDLAGGRYRDHPGAGVGRAKARSAYRLRGGYQAEKAIYALCEKTDIAFVEGMFLPEHAEHAEAKGHLTADDAARIAGRSEVGRAVLIHISPRYSNDDLPFLDKVAKARFSRAEIGEDFKIYRVPFSDKDEV